MRISNVLRSKGDQVVTVRSDASVESLLALLAEYGIGAVVVSDDGRQVQGIVSERDIVRHLHRHGAGLLGQQVSTIMTVDVQTCDPDSSLVELAATMTERRIRHIPVLVEGQLRGIVSIGDVVRARTEALQAERDQLQAYIQQ